MYTFYAKLIYTIICRFNISLTRFLAIYIYFMQNIYTLIYPYFTGLDKLFKKKVVYIFGGLKMSPYVWGVERK
jgi:hypothetical protein